MDKTFTNRPQMFSWWGGSKECGPIIGQSLTPYVILDVNGNPMIEPHFTFTTPQVAIRGTFVAYWRIFCPYLFRGNKTPEIMNFSWICLWTIPFFTLFLQSQKEKIRAIPFEILKGGRMENFTDPPHIFLFFRRHPSHRFNARWFVNILSKICMGHVKTRCDSHPYSREEKCLHV